MTENVSHDNQSNYQQ